MGPCCDFVLLGLIPCVLVFMGDDNILSFFLGVLLFCFSFKSLSHLEKSSQKDRFVHNTVQLIHDKIPMFVPSGSY